MLPAEGFKGRIPKFPLPKIDFGFFTKDGERVEDLEGSESFARREKELWRWAWRTPQAVVWFEEPWRQYTVAMWVRTAATCETQRGGAADKTAMLRLADQIGLTPAGLAANQWQVGKAADSKTPDGNPGRTRSSRSRVKLKVVGDGGA
ncbi:MAG: hypothetical protein LKJ18_01960 [Ancrocorticia sp.]|jgi:hypothetical protein|nr:hypothetical protein [Ancrocorticia sp.]MCI1962904.1 hypothetical protein [Ancrocorticia sp.]MCI2001816.1 hypothetical protein [Ancrocorticia sp.]MCI2001869.1 hypothetical protein [Ancrocorticia sp.]